MLDWNALRVVLNIYREGSLASASRRLRVSQPTLSRQLARVESDLACRLFDRRQGRLVATKAGLIVVEYAETVERQLRGMEDNLRSIDEDLSGTIRISAPQQLFPFVLGDVIKAFQDSHPDISLDIRVTDQLVDFASGNVDLVFRAEENPKPSLWGRKLAKLDFMYFAHKDLLARFGGNSEQLADIDGLPLIVHEGSVASSEPEVTRFFPKGRIVLRSDSLETSACFVQLGMGVGRMPWFLGNKLTDVEALHGLVSPSPRSLWILTHKDLRNVRRIEKFIDFVACHAGEMETVPSETQLAQVKLKSV